MLVWATLLGLVQAYFPARDAQKHEKQLVGSEGMRQVTQLISAPQHFDPSTCLSLEECLLLASPSLRPFAGVRT